MESFHQREDASKLLDAIADAEVGTYLSSEHETCVPVSGAERVLVVAASIVGLVAIGWLLSRDAWWGLPAGVASSIAFVMLMSRIEQRRTKVRPKFFMPRGVIGKVLRDQWPVFVSIALLTPVVLFFLSQERDLLELAIGSVVYVVAMLALILVFQRVGTRLKGESS